MEPVKLVAIVDSPLQALNLLEFSQRYGREVVVVVVGDRADLAPNNRRQIEAVLSYVNPQHILYHEGRLWPKNPRRSRQSLLSAVSALHEVMPAGPLEFLVGEYRSAFTWAVLSRVRRKGQRVVVLDDGTSMLRIDRTKWMPRSREEWLRQVKRYLYMAFGIRGVLPQTRLAFFTVYAISERIAAGDTIIRNDYQTLSAELRALPPDNDSVYVIGTPHREAGVVDRADVEIAVDLGRFAAELTGKNVIYMAHRRERLEKLEALRTEFTVVTPDVPFEIFPRQIGKRPLYIVGYYSSLFVTVADLLKESVEIYALQLPREYVNDSWLEFVNNVYHYYLTELDSTVHVVERSTPPPSLRR